MIYIWTVAKLKLPSVLKKLLWILPVFKVTFPLKTTFLLFWISLGLWISVFQAIRIMNLCDCYNLCYSNHTKSSPSKLYRQRSPSLISDAHLVLPKLTRETRVIDSRASRRKEFVLLCIFGYYCNWTATVPLVPSGRCWVRMNWSSWKRRATWPWSWTSLNTGFMNM